jgi:hypothetical protein
MTTGTKAQVVGKGLYIETSNSSNPDRYTQILVIPNLPDELGRKRNHTLVFSRVFDIRSSRNSWSYPTAIALDTGIPKLEKSLLDMPNTKVGDDYMSSYYPRMSESKVEIETLDMDLIAEGEKAGAHANSVLLVLVNHMSRDRSRYDKMSVEQGGEPYPDGFERVWNFDTLAKSFAFEITDRDMLDLYNDHYKVPSSIVNRVKQARLRVA